MTDKPLDPGNAAAILNNHQNKREGDFDFTPESCWHCPSASMIKNLASKDCLFYCLQTFEDIHECHEDEIENWDAIPPDWCPPRNGGEGNIWPSWLDEEVQDG